MRRSDAVQVGLRYNRGVKVLVVEDEATLSQQIADALGAFGGCELPSQAVASFVPSA